MDNYYSTDEVGEILGVPKRAVQRWVRTGQLTALKLGREYRIREADLEAFLKAREKPAKAVAQEEAQ